VTVLRTSMSCGGSGCGAGWSANTTSGSPSMVWKVGAGPGRGVGTGATFASLRSSTSGGSAAAGFGGAGLGAAGGARSASTASTPAWPLLVARGVGGSGGGGAAAGRVAANGGFGAAGSSGLAVLPPSSSAIMRRMEARISSIEGSCAFAAWLIPSSRPTAPESSHDSPASVDGGESGALVRLYARAARIWQMESREGLLSCGHQRG